MPGTAIWSRQLTLRSEPGSTALARQFVCAQLCAHGLHGLLGDVRLVVSELATDAIVHAQTSFTVTLEGDHESILLEVHNDHPSMAAPRPASPMSPGGRGMAIVDEIAARWGTRPHGDGGKTVWVWFDKEPTALA